LSILLHTGLGDLITPVEQKLQHASGLVLQQVSENNLLEELQSAEVFIVGPEDKNPIRTVQHINALDKYISIIVLIMPADFSKVKQALQFSPFIGKNSSCVSYNESLDLAQTLKSAALRTRQRRSFSKINQSINAATTVASTSVKIQDLGIFLEQAPIGAVLVDDQDNIIAINQRAKNIFGIATEKPFVLKDFFPGLSLQQLKLTIPDQKESKILKVNHLFLELHLSEVSNEEGSLLNILLINDITEYKKKEDALIESEALFRFMAEAMPQMVWTADEQGRRNFFNEQWINYTGLSLEELEGWNWTRIIHPEDLDQYLAKWEHSILSGKDFEFEVRLLKNDGSYRWHLVRGVARKDPFGKVLMWVGTNTDIQEQKAFAEELEHRVKERTYELERSNSELEQFVYVTSHDLQEPLRKIRMFGEMLMNSYNHLDDTSKKYLDKVNATALRMSTLLKELLNYTQLNKEYEFKEVDLNTVVEQVLIDLELVISQKQAKVNVGSLPVIRAVSVQMHQLFYNLINNALKFSKADVPPQVTITYRVAEREEVEKLENLQHDIRYCHIVVQDNGIGFRQKSAEQIFNIFQRLHNRSEYSGTGIGLAICKKVVTNHYGDIYAVSEAGQGAAFHILLPM